MGIEIKLLKSCQDLEPYLRAWEQLAIDALEPNPFYESWCLLPAIEFLSNEHKPWYILGFNQDEANQDNRLILFFPIIAHNIYKHLPVKHLSLWSHIHCFLHTPLVAKGFEHSVIAAFFTWLVQTKHLPKTMLWKRISGDGPFLDALKSFLFSHPEFFYHEESYRRAKLIHAYPSYEEHLAQLLPKKKIKACIHRYDRLAELGKVTYEQKKLTESDLDAWGEDFLKSKEAGGKDGLTQHFVVTKIKPNFLRKFY